MVCQPRPSLGRCLCGGGVQAYVTRPCPSVYTHAYRLWPYTCDESIPHYLSLSLSGVFLPHMHTLKEKALALNLWGNVPRSAECVNVQSSIKVFLVVGQELWLCFFCHVAGSCCVITYTAWLSNNASSGRAHCLQLYFYGGKKQLRQNTDANTSTLLWNLMLCQVCSLSSLCWLLQVAMETECCRMQWQVLDWNVAAIQLYQKLNATQMDELLNYRLSGDKLRQFASGKWLAVAQSSVYSKPYLGCVTASHWHFGSRISIYLLTRG